MNKTSRLNFRVPLFVSVGIICYTLANANFARGDGVTLSGVLTFQMFAGEKAVVKGMSSTNTFRVSLSSDGRYSFEVHPLYSSGIMQGKEHVIYLTFDGTDTYFVEYTEAMTGMIKNRPGITDTQPIDQKWNEAYISSGNYPFSPLEQQKRVHMLWLVFGAGKYIHDTQPKTIPLPWVAARWNLLPYGFRLEQELTADFPYIPRRLELIRDPSLDKSDLEAEWDRPEVDKPASEAMFQVGNQDLQQRNNSEFKPGDVACRLVTENYTNYNNLSVPLFFKIEGFLPPMKSKDHVRRRYVGWVTNIADLSESEVFRPPVIGKTMISDSRFRYRDRSRQVDRIDYKLNANEEWKSTNDAALKNLFEIELVSRRAQRFIAGRTQKIKLFAGATFLIIAVAVPMLIYRRSTRRLGRSR